MNIHLIAIGGAVMHNLAIALRKKGHKVTGSDDEIFDPALTNLKVNGLLPEKWGWYPTKITTKLDAVILGMHARKDNSELLKAQQLNIPIYSFPEYVYKQTKDKIRIVIGGSHGKTTITSMIMFVMKQAGLKFDYLVGSSIKGFDTMVYLSNDSKYAVFEGDEYLSSPLDLRPKFHHYKPHIAILSGIAWDHINVFPTFVNYVEQFRIFIESIEVGGTLYYFANDTTLQNLVRATKHSITKTPYETHPFILKNNRIHLILDNSSTIPLQLYGKHNLQNLQSALLVCRQIGISDQLFYDTICNFTGAGKRLQKIKETSNATLFYDFAHSPSKLEATTTGLKEQFPKRQLIACFELHTFSSLNKDFLPEYANAFHAANIAIVYYNTQTLEHKKLPQITSADVKAGFKRKDIIVFTNIDAMIEYLLKTNPVNTTYLMMSSGNFSGIDIQALANKLLSSSLKNRVIN